MLLIFFVLLNAWGGILQQYHIDDHLGINAETGSPQKLNDAQQAASSSLQTGGPLGGTLIVMIIAGAHRLESLFMGLQPGVQMLSNVVPPGPATSLVEVAGTIIPIIAVLDLLDYMRGIS